MHSLDVEAAEAIGPCERPVLSRVLKVEQKSYPAIALGRRIAGLLHKYS